MTASVSLKTHSVSDVLKLWDRQFTPAVNGTKKVQDVPAATKAAGTSKKAVGNKPAAKTTKKVK